MRIGLLVEPYEPHHASGMGYLLREMAEQMQKNGSEHEYVFYSSTPLAPETIAGEYTNIIVPRNTVLKFVYFFLNRPAVDVFLYVAPLQSLFISKHVPTVLLCQELPSRHVASGSLTETLKVFIRDIVFMKFSVARSSLIIVPTHATEKDVLQYYPHSRSKIQVIPDGYQNLIPLIPQAVAPEQSWKPYFFFTGKVKQRKNVHRIVSAFIEFKKKTHSPAHLVIGGSYGGEYHKQMWKEITEHHLEDHVHFVGYTSIEELCGYYLNALALVFTSLSEGFGMPILEAMSLGTPVITSQISSMGEIAKDAAVLVDPLSVTDIADALTRVYSDATLREELIQAGKDRSKEYSWERMGREYVSVLETLTAKNT